MFTEIQRTFFYYELLKSRKIFTAQYYIEQLAFLNDTLEGEIPFSEQAIQLMIFLHDITCPHVANVTQHRWDRKYFLHAVCHFQNYHLFCSVLYALLSQQFYLKISENSLKNSPNQNWNPSFIMEYTIYLKGGVRLESHEAG